MKGLITLLGMSTDHQGQHAAKGQRGTHAAKGQRGRHAKSKKSKATAK